MGEPAPLSTYREGPLRVTSACPPLAPFPPPPPPPPVRERRSQTLLGSASPGSPGRANLRALPARPPAPPPLTQAGGPGSPAGASPLLHGRRNFPGRAPGGAAGRTAALSASLLAAAWPARPTSCFWRCCCCCRCAPFPRPPRGPARASPAAPVPPGAAPPPPPPGDSPAPTGPRGPGRLPPREEPGTQGREGGRGIPTREGGRGGSRPGKAAPRPVASGQAERCGWAGRLADAGQSLFFWGVGGQWGAAAGRTQRSAPAQESAPHALAPPPARPGSLQTPAQFNCAQRLAHRPPKTVRGWARHMAHS